MSIFTAQVTPQHDRKQMSLAAGYMKHEGKQVKEQTKQKAQTATAAARRLLPPGVDEV
jgi:hypothetical protein